MNVSNVMTTQVSWVAPEATLPEIARRMRADDIGSVPVAENDRLIGMVTDRDIVVRAVAEGVAIDRATARQVMSGKVLYCHDDDSVASALKNMGENQVRRLPVLDSNKRLVGVVSLGDLSRAAEQAAGGALKQISRPGQESEPAQSS